ncbi:hypothetical protein EDD29_8007 [Actinocorallia herbida]|uniref:Uncharacterized protein n=1 Tax=Actinocorallia herbida TaxID=58109 RepID=A0A3N1D9T2_9ACTN|nr:hypothetical protein [Actinocorallia herbida]ROO90285.1 hypothetical protein EDD29_8007 [Actinocorallia herbida]
MAAALGFLLVLASGGDGWAAWLGAVFGIAGTLTLFEALVVRGVRPRRVLDALAPLAVLGLCVESALWVIL